MGWNAVYQVCVAVPAELVAAAVVMQYWITLNNAIWITVFGFLILISNVLLVRIYGEVEFTFACLKILLVVGMNLTVNFSKLLPYIMQLLTDD
jgi:amino acid transporter